MPGSGDPDSPGVGLADSGDAESDIVGDPDGVGLAESLGDALDGDGLALDGDGLDDEDGGGEDDDEDDGGGVCVTDGCGGGGVIGGSLRNSRIAISTAIAAISIIRIQDTRMDTQPALSYRPGHGNGHTRVSPGWDCVAQ